MGWDGRDHERRPGLHPGVPPGLHPGVPPWLGPGWIAGPPPLRSPSQRGTIAKGLVLALVVVVSGISLISLATTGKRPATQPSGPSSPLAGVPDASSTPRPSPLAAADLMALPFLEETECRYIEPLWRTVTCHDLHVPQIRGVSGAGAVRLHVAVYESDATDPETDPVVYLAGGPGGAALIDFEDFSLYPFLERRDLIVIDQRGTGASSPSLHCTESDAVDDFLGSSVGGLLVLRDCRDRLEREGVHRAAYTSAQNAADLADLRLALDIDEWNLYGISYGTRLALTAMRDHPDGIRSVILDGAYPPQVDLYEDGPRNAERAFEALFQACAGEDACRDAHPDLERRFYAYAAEMDAHPRTIPAGILSEEWHLDSSVLVNYLFDQLYDTAIIPTLPANLEEILGGDDQPLTRYLEYVSGSTSRAGDPWDLARGMYLSVQCAEELAFFDRSTFDERSVSVAREIVTAFDAGFLREQCRIWDVPRADPREELPVTSSIPALLLAGEFDPITPPVWADATARTLATSTVVTLPGGGHGVLYGSDCAGDIVDAFLEAPASELDTRCADGMERPRFEP